MRLYTIGHESAALEDILRLLQENNITRLVDIRSLPFSRKVPHFNRKRFTRSLAQNGITYTYLGDLLGGYPPDPSVYPGGEAKFGARVDYSAIALRDYYHQGIEELLRLAATEPTAVMCAEEDPAFCHRQHLVSQTLLQHNIEVLHIRHDGTLQPAWPKD